MKIDLKSFVAGVILVVGITLIMGAAGTVDKTEFGFAVPQGGYAIVTDRAGQLYVVQSRMGTAERVNWCGIPIKQ